MPQLRELFPLEIVLKNKKTFFNNACFIFTPLLICAEPIHKDITLVQAEKYGNTFNPFIVSDPFFKHR
jgi:hypothetical protein